MYLIGIIFSLLAATSGLKIEDVIAHQNIQQGQELTVDENLHDGKILVLSDGSTWEIAPQSLETSQSWIFPSPLKVEKIKHPIYSYKIISLHTSSFVLARPIAPYRTGSLNIENQN